QGTLICGTIATGGASSAGGWTTNNIGLVALSTSTDQVVVGATSTPYAKLTVVSGATGTTTLALMPAFGQTSNILDIYNNTGLLSSVVTASGNFGIGTTSPSATLSVGGNGLFSGSLVAGNTTVATLNTQQATTTSLAINGLLSTLLKTNALGSVIPAVAGVDYQAAGNYATFGYLF